MLRVRYWDLPWLDTLAAGFRVYILHLLWVEYTSLLGALCLRFNVKLQLSKFEVGV